MISERSCWIASRMPPVPSPIARSVSAADAAQRAARRRPAGRRCRPAAERRRRGGRRRSAAARRSTTPRLVGAGVRVPRGRRAGAAPSTRPAAPAAATPARSRRAASGRRRATGGGRSCSPRRSAGTARTGPSGRSAPPPPAGTPRAAGRPALEPVLGLRESLMLESVSPVVNAGESSLSSCTGRRSARGWSEYRIFPLRSQILTRTMSFDSTRARTICRAAPGRGPARPAPLGQNGLDDAVADQRRVLARRPDCRPPRPAAAGRTRRRAPARDRDQARRHEPEDRARYRRRLDGAARSRRRRPAGAGTTDGKRTGYGVCHANLTLGIGRRSVYRSTHESIPMSTLLQIPPSRNPGCDRAPPSGTARGSRPIRKARDSEHPITCDTALRVRATGSGDGDGRARVQRDRNPARPGPTELTAARRRRAIRAMLAAPCWRCSGRSRRRPNSRPRRVRGRERPERLPALVPGRRPATVSTVPSTPPTPNCAVVASDFFNPTLPVVFPTSGESCATPVDSTKCNFPDEFFFAQRGQRQRASSGCGALSPPAASPLLRLALEGAFVTAAARRRRAADRLRAHPGPSSRAASARTRPTRSGTVREHPAHDRQRGRHQAERSAPPTSAARRSRRRVRLPPAHSSRAHGRRAPAASCAR